MGLFSSSSTIPQGITAIQNFDSTKYLGQWYEIARMDFRFERNFKNVTATYSLGNDGAIKVENKGFDYKEKKWKKAIGRAVFVGLKTVAMLKVSFFRPFYAGYNVIAIDDDYTYALVIGKSPKYLWILSRDTTIPEDIKQHYLRIAENAGCNISLLVWTEHSKNE